MCKWTRGAVLALLAWHLILAAQAQSIVSPTHPRQGHWYYGTRFEAVWPDFQPDAARFHCTLNWLDAPGPVGAYPKTLETTSPAAGFEVAETGGFLFTVAALDIDGITVEKTDYLFRVTARAPYVAYAGPVAGGAAFEVKCIPEIERRGWTGLALPRADHRAVAYRDRLWVFGGGYDGVYDEPLAAGPVAWSPDGVTWQSPEQTNCPMAEHAAAAFNGLLWLFGAGGEAWSSLDGIAWTQQPEPQWECDGDISAIDFGGLLWLFLENGGAQEVWSSPDGLVWSRAVAQAQWLETPVTAVFQNALYAVTSSGFWRSADGATWQTLADNIELWSNPAGLDAADGRLWLLDDNGALWSSPDGGGWQSHGPGPWGTVRAGALTAWDGHLWMVGGTSEIPTSVDGGVWNSRDGAEWTRTAGTPDWHMRLAHATVALEHALWLLDGSTDPYYLFRYDAPPRAYASTNGIDWLPRFTTVPWSFRFNHTAEVLGGAVYVLGGNTAFGEVGDVWKHAGGTWAEVAAETPWGPRFRHASAAYDGRLWVLGGSQFWTSLNDVWWSEDGAAWTQATPAAEWGPRVGHRAAVFRDKLWVLGGRYGPGFNDVWYTEDGQAWEAAPDAPWTGRWDHAVAVYEDRLWVVGGRAGYPGIGRASAFYSNDLDDVWSTADGVTWREETAHAPFLPSSGHTALAFENRLWAVGSYIGAMGFGPHTLAGSNLAGFRYRVDSVPDTVPGPDDALATGPAVRVQLPQKGRTYWLHLAAEDDAGHRSTALHFPLGEQPAAHTADTDGDSQISLSELLRVVQFYNSGGLHCADAEVTEDGYAPGPGGTLNCLPHDADYAPRDWVIRLSELLRLVQLYNSGGYHPCPDSGTEDGFCVGLA